MFDLFVFLNQEITTSSRRTSNDDTDKTDDISSVSNIDKGKTNLYSLKTFSNWFDRGSHFKLCSKTKPSFSHDF